MTVEQFVMAYGAEQDRLRALLPEGFAGRDGLLDSQRSSLATNCSARL